MQGFFVTIEGIEGAGKTTLAGKLADNIIARGEQAVVTAEPGGDSVGLAIRQLLLDPVNTISQRAELLLFEAARAQHVDVIIRPALERGAVVICDRYSDSSTAYQGCARGIGIDTLKLLNDFATSGLRPDLTILLDLDVKSGLARQIERDRISAEDIAFHQAVRDGFSELARSEPERFVVIDAALPADEVLSRAIAAVYRRR